MRPYHQSRTASLIVSLTTYTEHKNERNIRKEKCGVPHKVWSVSLKFFLFIHKQYKIKQVRTNIGLADTLIPSLFVYIIYMGGTGPYYPIKILFSNHVYSEHTILNIRFGANRMFHVLKTPVYRFHLYGRYRILYTDDDNFWWCYLELVYKPKYQI